MKIDVKIPQIWYLIAKGLFPSGCCVVITFAHIMKTHVITEFVITVAKWKERCHMYVVSMDTSTSG